LREEKEFLHFIQNIHIVKGSEGSEGSEGSKGSEGVVAAGAAVYRGCEKMFNHFFTAPFPLRL
jgi:hypothetical protein